MPPLQAWANICAGPRCMLSRSGSDQCPGRQEKARPQGSPACLPMPRAGWSSHFRQRKRRGSEGESRPCPGRGGGEGAPRERSANEEERAWWRAALSCARTQVEQEREQEEEWGANWHMISPAPLSVRTSPWPTGPDSACGCVDPACGRHTNSRFHVGGLL